MSVRPIGRPGSRPHGLHPTSDPRRDGVTSPGAMAALRHSDHREFGTKRKGRRTKNAVGRPSGKQSLQAGQGVLESLVGAQHSECLMCGPQNPLGLKLRFSVQPDGSVLAMFRCGEAFRGYRGMLHGGVTSSLLDAAMTNALFAVGVVGVTAELNVRFLAPVALNRGAIVRAAVERDAHRVFYLRAELEQDERLMARATAKFLIKGCV
jgi:acyl-coenzyme A thioesterase PaaI-like protein